MGKPSRHLLAVLAICLPLAFLCSCAGKRGARATLRTSVQGREVTAVLRGWATIANSEAGDAAVIKFGGTEIRVETDRLLVDGVVRGNLPADARRVEVVWFGNELIVTADGQEVFKGQI
jgi:hypothetical protein